MSKGAYPKGDERLFFTYAKYISTGGFENEIKGHRINRTGH